MNKELKIPTRKIGYDEAIKEFVDRIRLKGFTDFEVNKYANQFIKGLNMNGIYDAHEIRRKVDDFSNIYFSETDSNSFDFSVSIIGKCKYTPQNQEVSTKNDPVSFFGEGIYRFIMEQLDKKNYHLTLENIIDCPVTRNLFEGKTLREKIKNIKFLAENYHPIDQRIIYEVVGLKEDGSIGNIKWTDENTKKVLNIINNYSSKRQGKYNFLRVSPLTSRIYHKLYNHPIFSEDFKKALNGKLNQ